MMTTTLILAAIITLAVLIGCAAVYLDAWLAEKRQRRALREWDGENRG